ncbi:MAG: single-stranded-DNA-specific exonuclease RecJ [Chloroflexota bacterium]|nr:single-stranded-DNA-specific exonuclease RecJ [Chloroflexota bacterium]
MSLHLKRWQVAPAAPPGHIALFPQLHPITVQVLYNRGITDPADVTTFLSDGGDKVNPFVLQGMHAAVTRLRQALRASEPIAVYGDFDADGVTSTALVVQILRSLGGRVRPYIPHRVDEGYGLRKEALTQLASDTVSLVVTVDCGVRSLDEIAHANRLGLDVIVTDHHSVGDELPEAVAVIDPKRADSRYPFGTLAGVGVAYKLAQALLRSHRQTPVTAQEVRLEEEDLLDLVALGTVADLVPLLGENRTLVRRGLARINRLERPGIEALCRQANLKPGQVDTTAIGYVLGPRLNAAGRMAHAKVAYQLLETEYSAEAERLANELNRLNRKRQVITLEIQERARQLALDTAKDAPLLFAAAPDFPAGIVGLVASRLVDEFYRPALVVQVGEKVSRGSARSIPEFHVTDALDECTDLLVRHGGHAAAAGFTVSNENLDSLADRLRSMAAERLAGVELAPVLTADVEVELAQMSWELEHELASLEPCGYANPHPLFLSRNIRVLGQRAVGNEGRHLKLALSDSCTTWDGIAFRQGEWAGKLPDQVDIVYHLEVNEWNDRRRLQLNLLDVRPAGLDDTIVRLWFDQDEPESTEA